MTTSKQNEADKHDYILNFKPHSFSPELLEEFLFNLANTNNYLTKNFSKFSGIFKRKSTAIFIFNMCDRIGLSNESKFLAIELFDRFMCVQLKEIEEAIKKDPTKNWNTIFEKIKDQTLLRSLSCIQLSNKINSNNIILKCSYLKELLKEMGYNFSLTSILNSELRVFKSLDFKLNIPTPFQFIEILLEVMTVNTPELDSRIFYLISVKILESFYCQRDEIYDRLYESITGRTRDSKHDRETFLPIENDYLYLSSSIIVASAFIYDNDEKKVFKLVLESIALITKLDKDDLNEFGVILCHFSIID